MSHFEIILCALSVAFTWVHALQIPLRIKELDFKPLNCTMCLTGWISFVLALSLDCSALGVFSAILFAAVGVFVGSMFESIMMKYL